MKLDEINNFLEQNKINNNYRKIISYQNISSTKSTDRLGNIYTTFSSNNYLGLSHNEETIEKIKNFLKFGLGSTGSRLTSGAGFFLEDLENKLIELKKKEKVLIFNTGYMTNLGTIYALCNKNDIIFSDELNHASIIDGCKISGAKIIIYKHLDMTDLENKLKENDTSAGQKFIITDAVFSMDGDIADLPNLIKLKKLFNACLIIDEAHSFGTIGKTGKGITEYFNIFDIDIIIGTLSKAVGSLGGYVASSKKIIDFLINKSRSFIFSTSLPEFIAISSLENIKLIDKYGKEFQEELQYKSNFMKTLLLENDINITKTNTPIIPIIVGDSKKALFIQEEAKKEGFLLSAIRPPSVEKDKSRIRLNIIRTHTINEIKCCAKVLKNIFKKIKN